MDEKSDMLELSRALSDISKNKPKAWFKLSYTETEGNVRIHKAFQEFCFERTNNEYLAGIGLLLEYAKFVELMNDMNDRITRLEAQAASKDASSQPVGEVKNEVKTF